MEEERSPTSTILLMSKIGAMLGLGFGSLALGMLPLIVDHYRAKRRQKCPREITNSSSSTSTSASQVSTSSVATTHAGNSQGLLTSLLLCFGGGVLLFTTFLHLAPEVRISVETHQANHQLPIMESLSLAELLFCAGFFLVYLVEEAVHAALTGKPDSSDALLYRTVSVRRCNNQSGTSVTTVTTGSTTTVSSAIRSTWKDEKDEVMNDTEERIVEGRSKFHLDVRTDRSKNDNNVLPAIFVLSSPSTLSTARDTCQDNDRHRSDLELAMYPKMKHHHDHDHGEIAKDTSIRGLLTVLALSFHAIFEGLAVGLEPSISSVIYLAAAIATHKLVISFCVGMELYVAGASTKTTLGYLSVFSMVTPIGIAVGLVLGHFKNDSETLGATPTILQGMAAGTLLYVVFFEVLAREKANEKSGLLQLAAIIIGFMLMLGLQIATAHSHSHGDHGHGGSDEHGEEHREKHEHNTGKMAYNHYRGGESGEGVIEEAIGRVTEGIADVVSTVLSSTTAASVSSASSASTVQKHLEGLTEATTLLSSTTA